MDQSSLQPQDGLVSEDTLWARIESYDGVKFYAWTEVLPLSSRAEITAASWSGGAATIITDNAFSAGQMVTVLGMTPSGYDGTYAIASASATQFTYATADPGGAGTVFGDATVSTFIDKPGGAFGAETIMPAYEPNDAAIAVGLYVRLVKTHYDGLLGWMYAVYPVGSGGSSGITSINDETGPAITLESAGGTVIITEPSANVVNFEIDTPFVVGVGAVVDSADVCDGAGTYSPIVYGGAVVDSKDTCAGVGVYTPPTFTGDGAVVDSADVLSVAASYTGFELFVAEMTAPIQQVSSGRWIYAWIEQTISPASGDYVDMPEGRSGDTISGPFMRERNDTLTCTPVYSLVRQRGNFGGQRLYDFEHCCTTGSVIGTGSLIDTVDTVEGVGEVTPTGSIGGGSVIDTADTCDGVATVDPVGFVGYGPLIDTVDLADGVATITPTGFVGAGALIDTVDTCAGVGYMYSNSDFTSEGGIAIGGVYQTMADIPVQGGIAIGGTI